MSNYNRVMLMGNLTRDPEVKYTPGGLAVCTLGLAVNRKYSTRSGESREEVLFVDIDVWDKQAENCKKYLSKGSPVFVEGSLQMDEWEDRETGRKRTKLKVRGSTVQFLGNRGERGDSGSSGGNHTPPPFPKSDQSGGYGSKKPRYQDEQGTPQGERQPGFPAPHADDDGEPIDDIPF